MPKNFSHLFESIDPDTMLLVAVSGGVDSMVLLDMCLQYWDRAKIQVIHVHHSIRGADADADLEFITNFCNNKNITLYSKKYDIPQLAKEQKKGIEETGRKYRYGYFGEVAQQVSSPNVLLTAHHLDDRIETMIFNLIRGSSLDGLVALKKQEKYLGDREVPFDLYRPLFDMTKQEIKEYAKIRNIKYREDATNLDTQYIRNFLRNDILPKFAIINPEYQSTLKAFMEYTTSLSQEQKQDVFAWLNSQKKLYKTLFSKYENSQYIFSKEDFLDCSNFFQKQIFAFIYREVNNTSNGLSKSLLEELCRFVGDKNSYGKKQIKNLFIERRGEWIVVHENY